MDTTNTAAAVDWGKILSSLQLKTVLSVLLTLVICLVAIRLVRLLLEKVLHKTSLDPRTQKYVLSGVKIAMWITAILIVADQLGIPITSLVALLSVLSLAISLAVQAVLGNIAGGLVIFSTKPYQVGDYIQTDNVEGFVRNITLTNTQLDTRDGQRVIIPNSALSAGKITNWSTLGRLRVIVKFSATYDAAIDDVKKACMGIIENVVGILSDPAPSVHVENYGESNIDYAIYCWCKVDDYYPVYYGLIESLQGAFAKANVEFSYNHLNVHILDK